jgi:hypothetical protein
MIQSFTDTEYAVIYDALAMARDNARKVGVETPNIDSALDKLGAWADPSGCGFVAVTGEDADRLAEISAGLRGRNAQDDIATE